MFNASPYVPSIHLSNALYPGQTPNMNLGPEMQRRTAELAERQARGAKEDAESDDDYHQDRDVRGRRNYDYRGEDMRDFRREQDDLEIAHMEKRVKEANHALEDAIRDLEKTKMRIRNRRREERQQLNERSRMNNGMPEFVRPFVDGVYERASQQPIHDYLSPGGNGSRPPTPQPCSSSLPTRSRSPSPYRFTSRSESEIPRLPSQSVLEPRSRSRTPNPTLHKGKGDEAFTASQEQVYESFSKIHDLAKEFQTLKQNFVYPSVIEFQKPGSQAGEIITVRARSAPAEDESDTVGPGSEGKLAYTRTNEALHTYSYAMEKLLGKLDSVDSWNEMSVRTKRRGIIGEIEQEASRLERYRRKVWRDYCTEGW